MSVQLHDLPRHYPRSCFTANGKPKRIYPTLAYAAQIANLIEETKCVEMNAYQCPYCRGFHIGKRPEWLD